MEGTSSHIVTGNLSGLKFRQTFHERKFVGSLGAAVNGDSIMIAPGAIPKVTIRDSPLTRNPEQVKMLKRRVKPTRSN